MENVSFSIIMPVFNTKDIYLRESINNVLDINYSNYELIIVNDGSNTETSNIIDEYKDKCIVLTQNNSGQIVSRINGVKIAKNDYILFVDSDDLINKEILNILNDIINKNKSDVVMFDPVRFNEHLYDRNIKDNKYFEEGKINKEEVYIQLSQLHINSICCKCAKRELFDLDLRNYNCSVRNGEDLEQSIKILKKAKNIYYSKEDLYFYRMNTQHDGYYDISRISDINAPIVLKDLINESDVLKEKFVNAVVKNIIYNAFRISIKSKNKEYRVNLLNELKKQEISKLINESKELIYQQYNLFYNLIYKNKYTEVYLLAKIYNAINKIE